MHPTIDDLAAYLDEHLEARTYDAIRGPDNQGDQNGIYRPSSGRPVSRLALALEPWAELEREAMKGEFGALFLHRPWQLTAAQNAALKRADVGVLAYHLSFDEHLTLGYNPALAAELGCQGKPEILGFKEARPLGMLVRFVEPLTIVAILNRLRETFGGLELVHASDEPTAQVTDTIAVMGAMTDALVRETHERGACVYVTGQRRQPADLAVRETGIAVAAVGHLRSEVWGLSALAQMLSKRFGLVTVVKASAPR